MNDNADQVNEGQTPAEVQPGDTVSIPVTQAPGRTVRAWPDVKVEGWPVTVLFEIVTPEARADGEEDPNIFLMDARPIGFTGTLKALGMPGQKVPHLVILPDDWQFLDDGPTRAEITSETGSAPEPQPEQSWRQVPAVLPSMAALFEFKVDKLARKSVLTLNGVPLTWAKRVSLDIPAGGLSTLKVEGSCIEGISTGEAIPSLLLTCLARGDRNSFADARATLPAVFDLLESRSEEVGADIIMGSCHIPTPEGARLATFAVALTEPRTAAVPSMGEIAPFRLPETVDAQNEAATCRTAFNILAASVDAGGDEQAKAAVKVLRRALTEAGTAQELRNSLPRLALEVMREAAVEMVKTIKDMTPGAAEVDAAVTASYEEVQATEGQSEGQAPETAPQVTEGEGEQ